MCNNRKSDKPIANRMKTIQGMIAQYFIDKNVKLIKFISASNKLKNFKMKQFHHTTIEKN